MFFFCFTLMINQYRIKQKNRKTIFNPRINLKQSTFSDATCSKGNLCSLSRLAAIGASSLSAKSLHVWRNISCVSGSLARFDIDLLFVIHFPVPNRSKMPQTWFLGEVKVDAKLRDHIVAILTFGTRPRISESTLHVWTSKLRLVVTQVPPTLAWFICYVIVEFSLSENSNWYIMLIRRLLPRLTAIIPVRTTNSSPHRTMQTWSIVKQTKYMYCCRPESQIDTKTRLCWNCKALITSAIEFFCPSCNVIQRPLKKTTYFDIMDR